MSCTRSYISEKTSHIIVYPNSASRNYVYDELKRLDKEINKHVDSIYTEIEEVETYIDKYGTEHGSLFDCINSCIKSKIYGYYSYKVLSEKGRYVIMYADSYRQLCELAFKNYKSFVYNDSCGDKLTNEQLEFLNSTLRLAKDDANWNI